jgi:magnesium-transporting ATPase (P-type)
MQKGEEAKIAATAKALQNLKKIDDFPFHKLSVEDCAKELKTDLKKGLTDSEVQKRLKEYGPNELDEEE